jgi:penicillin-binding protein 1A
VHDFQAPADAKYAIVNGNREVFRPGTEPTRPMPATPGGPPSSVITPNSGAEGPNNGPPAAGAPPPKKAPQDLNGLY